MKLRTSFFNSYILRKNLTRFAPLWILYSIAEVLGLIVIYREDAFRIANDLNQVIGGISVCHCIYALLVALCLFGDLFDSRMCNGIHSFPMRREGWLLTGLASGLVFALIPAVVGGLVGAVMLREFYWIALVWQGVSLLQFLFFFGVAVFSAMCAGKKLAAAAIYGIFNILSLLINLAVTGIYEPLLHGVVINQEPFSVFSPVAFFTESLYMNIKIQYPLTVDSVISLPVDGITEPQLMFNGFVPSSWMYLGICVGVGLGMMVLACLLYRRRHLETAGNFISFRPMGYFFLLVYTVGAGLLLYAIFSVVGMRTNYILLTAGMLIGYFTGWMLLERTTKIFNKKVFAIFGIFAVVFAGSVGLTMLDPLGVQTRIPTAEEIETVCMYPTSSSYRYNNAITGWYIDDPEEIQWVQRLHQQMIDTPEEEYTESIGVEVRYQLKNGLRVLRRYQLPAGSQVLKDLQPFLSDIRSVFATSDWAAVRENVESIRLYNAKTGDVDEVLLNEEQMQAMLTAIERDCAAGTMVQHYIYHRGQEYLAGITLEWATEKQEDYPTRLRGENITVYEDSIYVNALLEELLQTQTP